MTTLHTTTTTKSLVTAGAAPPMTMATMTATTTAPATAPAPAAPVKRAPSRMDTVSLADANTIAFPRVFGIMNEGSLWPCLYFPNYDVMLHELDHEEVADLLTMEDRIELAMSWFDQSNEKMSDEDDGRTVPFVALLGNVNKLILFPQQDQMTHFARGLVTMQRVARTNPELGAALHKISNIYKLFKKGSGVKRTAHQAALVRPSSSVAMAVQQSSVASVAASAVATTAVAAIATKPAPTDLSPGAVAAAATPTNTCDAAATTATTNSTTETPADKKAAAPEDVPQVSPGGDSVGQTNISNKRAKLSRSPPLEQEYISKEGNAKLDAIEKAANATKLSRSPPLEQEYLSKEANQMLDEVQAHWQAKPQVLCDNKDEKPESPKAEAMMETTQTKETASNAAAAGKASVSLGGKGSMVQQVWEATTVNPTTTAAKFPAKESVQEEVEAESKTDQEAAKTPAEPEAEDPESQKEAASMETETAGEPGKAEKASAEDMEVEPKGSSAAKVDDDTVQEAKDEIQDEPVVAAPKSKKGNKNSPSGPSKPKPSKKKTTKNLSKAPATPSLHSKDTVELSEEERHIPTYYDIRSILLSAGFNIRAHNHPTDSEFCFPGCDRAAPVEGENYFRSMEAFRARLCSHGFSDTVPVDLLDLFDTSTEQGAILERWVRLSVFEPHIKLSSHSKELPEFRSKKLNFKDLKTIGFSYTGTVYSFPDATPDSAWSRDGKPISFYDEKEFHIHLSRFGYPKECDFSSIGGEDVVAPYFFLPLVFHERDLVHPSPRQGRGSRTRKSTGKASEASASTKKAKKARKDKKTNTSSLATPLERLEPQPSSPSNCDKLALEDCHRNPPGTSTRRGSSKNDLRRDISAEIEEASKDVDKLQMCLERLESTNASESTWLGEDGSHFRTNAFEVKEILEDMVSRRALNSNNAVGTEERNALYICGSPGIGKTTAVNWCSEQLIERNSREQFLGDNIDLVVVNINCSQFASGGASLKDLFFGTVLTQCNPSRHHSKGKDAEAALRRSLTSTNANDKKRFLILVLDEVDQLVDPTSESNTPKGTGEKLVRHLGNWASDDKMRFALIGIGNAMNNSKFRRVSKFVKFCKTYTFKSYDQEDMVEIMSSRLEDSSVVQPAALTFIAKKCAAQSGDVRKAIEHLVAALKDAKSRADDHATVASKLLAAAPKQGQFLVSMRDVVKVNSDYTKLSKLIEGLPLHTKLAVSVAAKMVQGRESDITRSDFTSELIAVYHEKSEEIMNAADAGMQLDCLLDMGIATIETSTSTYDETAIKFNYLPQELETAAETALGKAGYFDM